VVRLREELGFVLIDQTTERKAILIADVLYSKKALCELSSRLLDVRFSTH
jgi:hypothetical protein